MSMSRSERLKAEHKSGPSANVIVGWLAVVALAAVVGGGLYLYSSRESSLPPLTEAALTEAMSRWNAHGPSNYDIDVVISGRQTGNFHLEIRDSAVVVCKRDGVAPLQHTWDTWSVAGQFETLEMELDGAKDPETMYQVSAGTEVHQRALFHPELGIPLRYERHVVGADRAIGWRVTHYAPAKAN